MTYFELFWEEVEGRFEEEKMDGVLRNRVLLEAGVGTADQNICLVSAGEIRKRCARCTIFGNRIVKRHGL